MSSPSSTSSSRPSYSYLLPYTIPNCIALQVISGDTETPLSKGDLTLSLPTITGSGKSPSSENPPSSSSTSLSPLQSSSPQPPSAPILLAFVGKILFPLYKDTNFGTFTNNPLQYAFDFRLSKDTSTQVKLVLPTDVTESVQDGFEEILIQSGLLLSGLRATGDEIMRSAKQGGIENSQRIKQGTKDHIENTPGAGNNPLQFSKSTHDGAANFTNGSNTVYQYALSASNVITGVAGSAGASIRKSVSNINESLPASIQSRDTNTEPSDPNDMSDLRRAINEAASGITQGTSDLVGTVQQSASSAIDHNYGKEAKNLASSTGEGVKVNAKTLGHAIHAASLTGMGASAVQGAVEDKEKEKEKASK